MSLEVHGEFRHTGHKFGVFRQDVAVQQAAVADLTDNTLGTANSTLEAVPDPADAPATADALRDDLVANALPALRNNLADLGGKVNSILSVLRSYGFIAE